MDKPTIQIRALSADNRRQLHSLVSLFNSEFSDSYPIDHVYHHAFWQQHIGKRFISLGCFIDNQLVAHLACQRDLFNPELVQVSHAILSSNVRSFRSVIASMLWQTLSKLARRQNWKLVYTVDLPTLTSNDEFFEKILGTYGVAFCPSYYQKSGGDRKHRIPMVLSQRFIAACSGDAEVLYVPNSHKEICKLLYSSLGLKRQFQSASNNQKVFLSADKPALERLHFPKHSLEHLFIQPSLLSKETFNKIVKRKDSCETSLAFIAMRDLNCPAVCEELEAMGYRFCGILAGYHDRENIIYARNSDFNLTDCRLSERTSMLAEYTKNYDFNYATSFLSKPDSVSGLLVSA